MNDVLEIEKTVADIRETLADRVQALIKEGYIDNFRVEHVRMFAPSNGRYYRSDEVNIDGLYRWVDIPGLPANSMLYAISTNDGVKGMIMDVAGGAGNNEIRDFITDIEFITIAEAE